MPMLLMNSSAARSSVTILAAPSASRFASFVSSAGDDVLSKEPASETTNTRGLFSTTLIVSAMVPAFLSMGAL